MPLYIPQGGDLEQIIGNYRAKLPNWRIGLNNVKYGHASTNMLHIGDSTFLGTGSNYAASGNWKGGSVAVLMAKYLNSIGINAHANSWRGDGFVGSASAQWDTRLAIGSSFSQSGNFVGGASFQANTTTNSVAFTPAAPVDTFVVYNWQAAITNTFSIDINGAGTTNYSSNGTPALGSHTIATTLGTNTCNAKYVSGANNLFLLGMDAYDSSKQWINIINAGWYGSKTSDWVTMQNGGFVPNYYAQNQSLSLINLGINDWNNAVSLSTFYNNILSIGRQCALAGSDVAISSPIPSNPSGNAALSVQLQYVNVLQAIATQNGWAYFPLWESWLALNFNAGAYYDALHGNGAGYSDLAQMYLGGLDI